MATQTLIFVLLPNGLTASGKIGVSVYLTPRLDKGSTLSAFPDILNWTSLVQTYGLKFTIACAGNVATVNINPAVLRPDVWQAIFTASTYVEPFKPPAFDQRLIVSYPQRDAMTFFKYAVQQVGTGLRATTERGGLQELLNGLVFRDGNKNSTLAAELSAMRLTMWNEQRQYLNGGIAEQTTGPAITAIAPPATPDGIATSLSAPANVHDTITRFALFHSMPPAPNRPPLPNTPADFAKTLDFHRALTSLTSYPSLLRALGLVFDLELPSGLCPNSPAGASYGTINISKVVAGFKWSIFPAFTFPATAYVRDATSFRAAPASNPGATGYKAGDIANGFLALGADNFNLLQVDIDGGLLKQLGLADNVANAREQSIVGTELPSLRSGGIGLAATGRALQLLQAISDNTSFNAALASNKPLPRPFNAMDLTRGFRIDVWPATKKQWYSLHKRRASYRFGVAGSIVIEATEEGFLQPAAAQPADDPTRQPDPVATANNIPQPGTDLYMHERVMRWDGWSLSAPRPGLALNRSPDPAQATTLDPTMGEPLTPFKMITAFQAASSSLPYLRIGEKYRVRARAVDLAGNSVPLAASAPASAVAPTAGLELPYLRFEPVSPPLVVLQQPTGSGASLERMVIRSQNSDPSLDAWPTMEIDTRHIAPPRVAERLAEHHGMFDDSNGRLKGDAATFAMITARDNFEFPKSNGVPIDPAPLVSVDYLPDPLARGAAFRNLPNTTNDTDGAIVSDGLQYTVLPDVQTRQGSVTQISFGDAWPERNPLLLKLQEGSAPPAWNAGDRVLTVSLPKGATANVDLSSYLFASDLTLLGVWEWLREYFIAAELAAMAGGSAELEVGVVSDLIALLTRLTLEGGHTMITPARVITLMHATQQPLGAPQFVQLPVVHQRNDPIFAAALRNSFTPITAWRAIGSHYAALLGALAINGATTAKIDLEARWLEYNDDPTQREPTKTWNSAQVETLPLPTTDPGVLYSDATETRLVGTYVPSIDALWFSAPIDVLEGVTTPSTVAAPLHRFNDTKHRWIGYTAIATSRFQEYFPTGLDYTRSSNTLVVDVPSSARPLSPDIAYVVPTFGWEKQESSNIKSTVRFGNGLRVYLNRPWYSSGDSELLGAVLWNGASPDYATREQYKHLFTQWGQDPIWKTGSLPDVPSVGDFPAAVASANSLTLEETTTLFDVAGHQAQFDRIRGLWYCDIEFYNPLSYMPFVRLALARYQPHSIAGTELSRVVLADYAQLTPDRSAVMAIDPTDIRRAQLFVGGVAPQAPVASVIEVTVEQRLDNLISDLAWEVAPAAAVKVMENSPDATESDAVLWSGSILFSSLPPAGRFRIVIREFERIQVDPVPYIRGNNYGERLVYVAILNYDYPSGS